MGKTKMKEESGEEYGLIKQRPAHDGTQGRKVSREIYELRWNEEGKNWCLIYPAGIRADWRPEMTKKRAIELSAILPRVQWKNDRILGQLRVFKKNSQIAFERTYGKDPRRSKG